MFWDKLDQFGDNVALINQDGGSVTYAALLDAADQHTISAFDRSLLLLSARNDIASIAAYLAALRAGHAVILVNDGDNRSFDTIQDRFQPTITWSGANGVQSNSAAHGARLHDDLTLLLSTSGSTGSAKLVCLSGRAVNANAASICEYLGIASNERAITTLPPAYSFGLSIINSHLCVGASLILNDHSVTDPQFRELAVEQRATSISGVPYTYDLLIASGGLDALPPSVRTLTQAGGRLSPETVNRVRLAAERQSARFFVMYGQTEATARMSYVPPEQLAEYPECIGRPIPGGRFMLIDPDTGSERSTAGELVYSGPNVMMGYAEDPTDLAKASEGKPLATGDLAELVAPEVYRITGRKSRFLKIFGLRLSLDEIEAEAKRLGWGAIATGDDARIVLAVEGARVVEPLADEIARSFGLPADRVVAITVDVFPRLLNKKIDYLAIRKIAETEERPTPHSDALATYARFLARLSGRREVSETACFQEIGGDSLNYVEASILVESIVGNVPPNWETMTLGELAAARHVARSPELSPRQSVRVEAVQMMRAVAIILVVAAHSVRPVSEIVGMQSEPYRRLFFNVSAIFIFVAGYLFQHLLQNFNYPSYIRVKAANVLSPYLITSIPIVLIYRIAMGHAVGLGAPGWVDTSAEWIGYLVLTGTSLGPLWFVPMILLIYLIAPALKFIDDRPLLYWLIVPLSAASAFVGRPMHNNNPIQELIFFLPVYVFGMLVSRQQDRILPLVSRFWLPFLIVFFIPVILDGNSPIFDRLSLLAKVISSLGLLGVCVAYSSALPKWLIKLGELSFGIYFIHGYILLSSGPVRHLLQLRGGNIEYLIAFPIAVTCVLIASVVIVLGTSRLSGRYSRELIGV